ncbi:MAG: RluA family pseudouridine synthase [Bosea sp. (in: a-proteobacteria)]
MPSLHHLAVPSEAAGSRLDKWLATGLPDFSRSRLQALITGGDLTLDGRVTTDVGHKLKAGQQVVLKVPPPVPAEPVAQDIPLDIVFEDADLIVINKPAGLVVHPAAGHEDGTLVNALIAHCGESLSGIGGVRRPGIVHRLDKDTSGILVVAKNDNAHRQLSAQFADHGRTGPLERAYLALVWGMPKRTHGTVNAAIDRSTKNREKMAVVQEGRGREAITHYEVLETYPAGSNEPLASLVRCELETGRTHQIRVHLAHLGHPVMGDMVYGSGFATKAARLPAGTKAALAALNRQALHAALLGFAHPVSGEARRFEVDPPDDFAKLQEQLANL